MNQQDLIRELSTKVDVSKLYGAIQKLIRSYGLINVFNAVKMMPLKHPNPIAYIIAVCRKKAVPKKINANIFKK